MEGGKAMNSHLGIGLPISCEDPHMEMFEVVCSTASGLCPEGWDNPQYIRRKIMIIYRKINNIYLIKHFFYIYIYI